MFYLFFSFVKRHSKECFFNGSNEKGSDLRKRSDALFDSLTSDLQLGLSRNSTEPFSLNTQSSNPDDFLNGFKSYFINRCDTPSKKYELNKKCSYLQKLKNQVEEITKEQFTFQKLLDYKYLNEIISGVEMIAKDGAGDEDWTGFKNPFNAEILNKSLTIALNYKQDVLKCPNGVEEFLKAMKGMG